METKNTLHRHSELVSESSTWSVKIGRSRNKFGMTNFYGFTLVELIVVITILVILGTIGFINIGGVSDSARDSARVTDMSNISKWLDILLTKNGTVLPPDANTITLTASGITVGYQGYAGPKVLSAIKMSDAQDPLDKKYYTYLTNTTYTKYQILGLFEDSSTKIAYEPGNTDREAPFAKGVAENRGISWIDTAFADGYDTRYPLTQGSRLGVLLGNFTGSVNQPIQELYNPASFTGVDVGTTATGYTAIFSSTASDRLSGTGIAMAQLASTLGTSGSLPFTKTLGGSGMSTPQGIFVDNFGYTYVTWRYDNSPSDTNGVKDFAGNPLPWVVVPVGNGWDIFVAKINSLGKQVWIRTMGGNSVDNGVSIKVDSHGDVYIGGSYANDSANTKGVKDFAGNPLYGFMVTGGSFNDAFVAKLSWGDGSQMWIKGMGWWGGDYVQGMSLDSNGNPYIAWYYSNDVGNTGGVKDFAGNTLLWTSGWAYNAYVAKLSGADGSQTWIKTLGWSGYAYSYGVTMDTSDNVYIAGAYVNNLANSNSMKDFAGNTLSGASTTVADDGFVAKLSGADGSQAWIKTFGGTGVDSATRLAVDSKGGLYVGGAYQNNSPNINETKDFAGNTLLGMAAPVPPLYTYDVFVAKLSSTDGSQTWIKTLGGSGADNVTSIAFDLNGNLYVGGAYNNSAWDTNTVKDFSGNPLLGVSWIATADWYMVKLSGTDGSQQWIKTFGGAGGDLVMGIASDSNGNMFVAGRYQNDNNPANTNSVKDFVGNPLLGNSLIVTNFTVFVEKL